MEMKMEMEMEMATTATATGTLARIRGINEILAIHWAYTQLDVDGVMDSHAGYCS